MVEFNLPLVVVAQITVFLFPGFLALKTRDGLTRTNPKPRKASEAWLPALLFDLPILLLILVVCKLSRSEAFTQNEINFITILLALTFATLVSLLTGALEEKAFFSTLARWLNLSRKIRQSPWVKSFKTAEREGGSNCWLVVHLKDGTRIFGWAKYYSADSNQKNDKEIFLARGEENGEPVEIKPAGNREAYEVKGPGVLITPQAEITRLEFLESR